MQTFSQTSARTPRSRTASVGNRIEAAALYGAFALIGAIVFGTLSVHPF